MSHAGWVACVPPVRCLCKSCCLPLLQAKSLQASVSQDKEERGKAGAGVDLQQVRVCVRCTGYGVQGSASSGVGSLCCHSAHAPPEC